MAEIPSDIASSAAQAGFKAREVAHGRNARGAAQANATERQTKSIDEAGNTVDTEDADTQVFADAEGSGGQGRSFEEANLPETEDVSESAAEGIVRDDDGRVHLDLEA